MSRIGAVIIGDEILSGKFVDENTPWLAKRCRELGLDLGRVVVVPDVVEVIADEVSRFSAMFDLVVTTGGVGPTHDDVTMRGVAAAFGVGLARHPVLERILREKLADRCNEVALRMADVPEGAELWWEGQHVWPLIAKENVAIFPGIPSLFQKKFEGVSARFTGVPVRSARLTTTEREHDIALRLEAVAARWPMVAIGSYPQIDAEPHTVTLTLDSRDGEALEAALEALRAALAPGLVG